MSSPPVRSSKHPSKNSESGKQKRPRSASSNRKQRSSPSRRTMGLDLSLTGTGLVVVNGNKLLRVRRYRTEPVPKGRVGAGGRSGLRPSGMFRGDDEERIDWLARKIVYNVKKYRPELCVIEGHSFASKGRGVSILHELHGVVKNRLFRLQQPFAIVSPQAVKKHATGSGNASKAEMIGFAKNHLCSVMGKTREQASIISDSDRADALWLAVMGEDAYDDFVEEEEESEAS